MILMEVKTCLTYGIIGNFISLNRVSSCVSAEKNEPFLCKSTHSFEMNSSREMVTHVTWEIKSSLRLYFRC